MKAKHETAKLSHQIVDLALDGPNGPHGSPNRNNKSETLCPLIETLLDTGDITPPSSPAGCTSLDGEHSPRAS